MGMVLNTISYMVLLATLRIGTTKKLIIHQFENDKNFQIVVVKEGLQMPERIQQILQ